MPFVGLIDVVRAGEEIPQTKEETRKRWERYARFAERTFNVQIPDIPYEHLETLDDAGQVQFVLEAVKQSGVQIPGGIIEHQRTSYLDNRAIDTAADPTYDGHVTLYMADRYHDDAIMFEPRYATRKPDGGWGEFVSDLEVVPIGGEHIQAIDEPIIAKVGAHMSQALAKIEAAGGQKTEAAGGQKSGVGNVVSETTAEKLAELRAKLEQAKEPGGEKAAAKREKKGIPSARARIHALLDPGSFLEIGALCKTPGDPNALFGDGVVTGHGRINGRPVGVF